MATSVERSQFATPFHSNHLRPQKAANPENFAKTGRVLSETIGLEPVVNWKQFRQLGSSKVIKWCHSTDHVRLPIRLLRLPKQLYAYLMPFRRYRVTKKGVDSVNKNWLSWQHPLGDRKNNLRSSICGQIIYKICKFREDRSSGY